MRRFLPIFVLLAACAIDSHAGGPRAVRWSAGTVSDAGSSSPLDCGLVAGHPCSRLVLATSVVVGSGSLEWGDFAGSDANGVSLEGYTYTEPYSMFDGLLTLPSRGDDGGLRFASGLAQTDSGGWAGEVGWHLLSVPGEVTFLVEIQ